MTGSQVMIYLQVGMALCLVAFILYVWKQRKLILECRNETSGEVIKIEAIPSGKDDIYLYQLIVSFDTGSGTVEGADACYMKKDDFSVGDHVTIRYNPDKPSVFYVVENHRYEYISKALITMIMAFPVLLQLIYYWMNK